MSLRLLYLIFQHMLGLLLLMGRTSSTKDIGCSDWTRGRRYPPHQPETRLEWADRAVIAALARRLPRALRCHRLSARAPSCAGTAASCARAGPTRTDPAGRPAIDDLMAALVVRMATENPNWDIAGYEAFSDDRCRPRPS